MFKFNLTKPLEARHLLPDKTIWLAALRSGEYARGTVSLCKKTSDGVWKYCCLGVLAEIKQLFTRTEEDRLRYIEDVSSSLPASVFSELKLSTVGALPIALELEKIHYDSRIHTSLANINDAMDIQLTFDKIADIIDFFWHSPEESPEPIAAPAWWAGFNLGGEAIS